MLAKFAKLIGVEPRLAEDALHSERAAKHVLSRRELFGVMGAMAGASVFSFGEYVPLLAPSVADWHFRAYLLARLSGNMGAWSRRGEHPGTIVWEKRQLEQLESTYNFTLPPRAS